MNARLRKIVPWVAYPAFYLLCFVLFAYLTFPFDRVRDRAIAAFNDDQKKTGGTTQLEIDKLDSYWLSGVEARGVRLVSPASVNPDGTKKPASEIAIDRTTVRVAMLPLLIGRVRINFHVEMLGGTIDGSTEKSGEDRKVEVELAKLSIGDLGALVSTIGLPMAGELRGHASLSLPEGKLSKATGAIDLTIADFSVADGKTKIKDTIALPRMNVGDLVLECDVAGGVVKVTKFAAAGQDLDFSADGKITLRDTFAESQADLYLKFRFSDKYKNKDDKTKALFGTPGSSAPALFEIADPRLRQSKRPDGFYSWRAWGMLKTLRFDPAPAGGASPRGPAGAGGIRGFLPGQPPASDRDNTAGGD